MISVYLFVIAKQENELTVDALISGVTTVCKATWATSLEELCEQSNQMTLPETRIRNQSLWVHYFMIYH